MFDGEYVVMIFSNEEASVKVSLKRWFLLLLLFSDPAGLLADTVAYSYDDLKRLKTAVYSSGEIVEYSYDAAGNRTTQTIIGSNNGDTPAGCSVVKGCLGEGNSGSEPRFRIDDVAAYEGDTLTFTITKMGSTLQSHSVNYATKDGSAMASDYTSLSGMLTFAAGETSKTVSILTVEDYVFETKEIFYVALSAATGGATIANNLGVGVINDEDPTIIVVRNESAILQAPYTQKIVKDWDSLQMKWVNFSRVYAVGGGLVYSSELGFCDPFDATGFMNSGLSFSGIGCELVYSPAEDTSASGPHRTTPSFSVNAAAAIEGDSLTFTITKMGAASQPYSVSYTTSNGSAVSPSDYTSQSATLRFTSSETSKTLSVLTTEDAISEPQEQFYLDLSAPTGGAIVLHSRGIGTINDNDISYVVVRNSGGVLQAPYTQKIVRDWDSLQMMWVNFSRVFTAGGGLVYSSEFGFCKLFSATGFIAKGYSFSGNGCEFVYTP